MYRACSIILLALSTASQAEPLFDPPEGLVLDNVPDISNSAFAKLEKFSDADGLVQVTVLASSPITYLERANEFMVGTHSGMKNKGFQGGPITDLDVNGYSCKKLDGVFIIEGYEEKFSATTLALFTSEFVYTLSLSVHDSAQFDFSVEELVDRLNIEGDPVELKTGAAPPSSAFQFGQGLGEVIGWLVIILAIILVVKRLNRNKAEQGEAPKP